MGFSVVIGPAIAPTLGGYLAEEYNWRWIFLLIVPLGVAVFFGILAYIKEGGKTGRIKFDALGFALFSIVIVSLQLILDRGERMDWYDSGFILSLTLIMGLAAYMYVANSWFVEEPFINPRLFTSRELRDRADPGVHLRLPQLHASGPAAAAAAEPERLSRTL